MTLTSRIAIGCAAVVAAAAAVVVVADPFDDGTSDLAAIAASVAATSSPDPTATPSGAAKLSARTAAAPTGPAPLSVETVTAAAPKAGGDYVAAEVSVELSSVCEGAALDLSAATPLYASLQTKAAPLQYLDAALAVYDSPEEAERSYNLLQDAMGVCPVERTVTPTPLPSATPEGPIEIVGDTVEVAISDRPAIQWVQSQTVAAPDTQLRTAVTVTLVENVIVVVSVDEDSETAGTEDVEAASLYQATHISQKLADSAAG